MNKRILHIIPTLCKGGAEKQLKLLLTDLSPSNYKHFVLLLFATKTNIDLPEKHHFTISSLNLNQPLKFITGIAPVLWSIIRWKPDIIQGWMFHSHIFAIVIWLILLGKPKLYWNVRNICITGCYTQSTKLVIFLNKILSNIPASIIYNSQEGKRSFEKYGFAQKGCVIPNTFIAEDWIPDLDARDRLRDDWQYNKDCLIIGIVGRYDIGKGYPVIMQAIKIVLDGGLDKVRFVFVGRQLRPENPVFESFLKDKKVLSHCHFLGELNNLSELYSAFDVFLSGSHCEGFSNVLAEAMLMKLPTIATDVGDNALILPPECGQIVPPDNPTELSKAILAIHAMLPKQRKEMGIRARQHIENNYTLANGLNAYYKLYSN